MKKQQNLLPVTPLNLKKLKLNLLSSQELGLTTIESTKEEKPEQLVDTLR